MSNLYRLDASTTELSRQFGVDDVVVVVVYVVAARPAHQRTTTFTRRAWLP